MRDWSLLSEEGKGLRITRLQLKNRRNFARMDVQLQRRVFLIGPNALGKSNFLDMFRFLHEIASVGTGFQAAVEKRRRVAASKRQGI
jgi:predicted ATPase